MQKISEALCFDDVLLEPQHFTGNSRSDIDISAKIGDFHFSTPIISANMSSITEEETAIAMAECGGLGIIHRFQTIEKQCRQVKTVSEKGYVVGGSIGIGQFWKDDVKKLLKSGVNVICLDVAHADQDRVFNIIKDFKKDFPKELLISGNIASRQAFYSLSTYCGSDAIKVGIGGGSVCLTRINTGCGKPTFQSLLDITCYDNYVSDDISSTNTAIIADGGIRNSGDCVKSFAAGAKFVMIGSLLAGCNECPGDFIRNDHGVKCKIYKGSASYNQKQIISNNNRVEHIEGTETLVPCKGTIYDVIDKLCEGIRSGFSYCGALNMAQLCDKAKFIKITPAGFTESKAHGVRE